MDLVIDEKDTYKIQLGAEIFEVSYPSWAESKALAIETKKVLKLKDGESKYTDLIIKTLTSLGLDPSFFDKKGVQAKHILQVWEEINTLKK